MAKQTRPKYLSEFHLEAAQLVVDEQHSIRDVAEASVTIQIYYANYLVELTNKRPH